METILWHISQTEVFESEDNVEYTIRWVGTVFLDDSETNQHFFEYQPGTTVVTVPKDAVGLPENKSEEAILPWVFANGLDKVKVESELKQKIAVRKAAALRAMGK